MCCCLLEVVIELFFFFGFDGVMVGVIEEKVGVQWGFLVYYYLFKDDLWCLVVDGLFEELMMYIGCVLDVLKVVLNVDFFEVFVGGFICFSVNYFEF